MDVHANAKLGPAGRFALCRGGETGVTFRAAGAAVGGAPATAHRWWHRFRVASLEERRSLTCLRDRSIEPAAALAEAPDARAGGADPAGAAGDEPGSGQVGGHRPQSQVDDLESASPQRCL